MVPDVVAQKAAMVAVAIIAAGKVVGESSHLLPGKREDTQDLVLFANVRARTFPRTIAAIGPWLLLHQQLERLQDDVFHHPDGRACDAIQDVEGLPTNIYVQFAARSLDASEFDGRHGLVIEIVAVLVAVIS